MYHITKEEKEIYERVLKKLGANNASNFLKNSYNVGDILTLCGFKEEELQKYSRKDIENMEKSIIDDMLLMEKIYELHNEYKLLDMDDYDSMRYACQNTLNSFADMHPDFLTKFKKAQNVIFRNGTKITLSESEIENIWKFKNESNKINDIKYILNFFYIDKIDVLISFCNFSHPLNLNDKEKSYFFESILSNSEFLLQIHNRFEELNYEYDSQTAISKAIHECFFNFGKKNPDFLTNIKVKARFFLQN